MNNIQKLKIIYFIKGLYFYTPIISLYFLSHGVSLSQVVISQVFYSIFNFLGDVPSGLFADRFGKKISIVTGYSINSLGVLMMILFPQTLGLYLAYALIGTGYSFLSGSEEALLYESHKDIKNPKHSYQKEYSIMASNELLGSMLATAIAGVFLAFFHEKAYVIMILLTVLSVFLSAVVSLSLKPIANVLHKVSFATKEKKFLHMFQESLKLIHTNKALFTLTIMAIVTLNGEYFLQGVYQPYFQQNHVPEFFLGFALSAGALANYFLSRFGYLLEKYLTLEKILFLFNGVLALMYLFMAFTTSPLFLVAAFIVAQGLFNVSDPIVSDYINQYVENDIRTTVLSTVSVVRTFFQIIARVTLGILVGAIGISHSLLVQGLYLGVGIIFGYWFMRRCGCVNKITMHTK